MSRMSVRVTCGRLLALCLVMAVLSSPVNASGQSAHQLVEKTTNQVMGVVTAADEYVEEDPERYYQQIEAILDPLIDYRGFARQVMGPYASSKRYRSLDEAGREELREQLDRFTAVMRSSLVRTYSKGLLAFGGSRIEVVAPDEDPGAASEEPEAASRISVRQLIYADRSQPYVVLYQMGVGKAGDWKLRNVIIESVNLGEIYRDQFLASAREEGGNLDQVIAGWTVVEVEVEAES